VQAVNFYNQINAKGDLFKWRRIITSVYRSLIRLRMQRNGSDVLPADKSVLMDESEAGREIWK